MKFIMALVCVVACVFAQSFYETKDDYVDIDADIADLLALQAFADCFLDKGPCTPLTQSYKDIIPATVKGACDRCNVPQKQRYGRFLRGLRERLLQDYQNYRQKYDPTNIYMEVLEAELAKNADQPPLEPMLNFLKINFTTF